MTQANESRHTIHATADPSPEPESSGIDRFDQLVQLGSEADSGEREHSVDRELDAVLKDVSDKLVVLTENWANHVKDLATIREEIARLKTDEQVMSEMHDRNRALSEDFHTREVLNPIWLMLIGIADRCRKQTEAAERTRATQIRSGNSAVLCALKQIRDARLADRIEIENLLANYGVESFEHPDPRFNAQLQKCIRRVDCRDAKLHGFVAQRVLPGYRREGRIVRQEYVFVYTHGSPAPGNGEQS